MKTKKVISIGLAAMMSFSALTCSAATAYAEEKKDEVAGGEDVTISIMGRKVEIHDAMLEAADRYMELHPNVTVVMETVGGGDDYDGTLKTRLMVEICQPFLLFRVLRIGMSGERIWKIFQISHGYLT